MHHTQEILACSLLACSSAAINLSHCSHILFKNWSGPVPASILLAASEFDTASNRRLYECETRLRCGRLGLNVFFCILAGDEIEFSWTGSHNVYHMKDKAAFEACKFDGSHVIGASSPSKYKVTGSAGTVHFFACQVGSHCTRGQKLAVTIAAGTPSLAQRVSRPKHVCTCASVPRERM